MKAISLEEVLLFHQKIINKTGGSHGIRDITLIDSAINRAFQTFDGIELYPEIEEKIAITTHSLINNHGFVDGNKRIGIATMLILLKINNIKIKYTQEEIIDLGLKVASGDYCEKDILEWIKNNKQK